MAILVTGGAGYIGSHTVVELLQNNLEVIVVDNLSNSSITAIKRVEQITKSKIKFYHEDILDKSALRKIFSENNIKSVIHFAGVKSVVESVIKPLDYYKNNFSGTLSLCEIMKDYGCKNLVFSSSATVYGDPSSVPISEDFPTSTVNPYGRSKLMIEEMLRDLYESDDSWNIAILRYFNPIGAHSSGLIGEDPAGIPNNLLPYISQVAVGHMEYLSIFGNDYSTIDGTGVRDYIHVIDLAKGHLKALNKLESKPGIVTYNLGTGVGYSVLQVVAVFEKVSSEKIPFKFTHRRAGDIAECWADTRKANKELDWKAELNIENMIKDSWNWQRRNPNGYK